MRIFLGLIAVAAFGFQAAPTPAPAIVQEATHVSQVLGGTRTYRVFLPPAYAKSAKRYPVIYWFYGYEQASTQREAEVLSFVATHDVIIVNVGPVEPGGQYPLYFPELADRVDKTLRTIADRDHRGVTGFSMGGFAAYWTAGKYPDLVSSASSFMGFPEATVGPADFDVDYNLEEMYGNLDAVRTRLVTGTRDYLRFYHRRLNDTWLYARTSHESENFDVDHSAPEIAKTLDFHMRAFASPLPKPAAFRYADVYPNFGVWGWEVVSDRKQPAYTVLENVSSRGFRSAVREWIPGGAVLPMVKLSITSPPLYPPSSTHTVMYIRLRDGKVRKVVQKADARGRLSFDVDGEAYEVGVSTVAAIAITGYDVVDAHWATAGKPVNLRVKFWNKGQARAANVTIQWESPNPGVKFAFPSSRVFGLGPGESSTVPVTFTVADPARAMVRIVAVEGTNRTPIEVPLFPPAEPSTDFWIADGRTVEAFQHATQKTELVLGEGNSDGHAAPGETFAILLPEGAALRTAEVFTNDACIDTSVRASDSWTEYDRSGAWERYSLPVVRADCPPGTVVHLLARILIPGTTEYRVRYASVEFPVWYRPGEEPKK